MLTREALTLGPLSFLARATFHFNRSGPSLGRLACPSTALLLGFDLALRAESTTQSPGHAVGAPLTLVLSPLQASQRRSEPPGES
jgi:hypothetical protein